MFKVVVYWRWSLTRRGRYERVNCKHVKGVLFVNRKYTKGVPFLSEKKGYKGVGLRGGASPNETLLSSPPPPPPPPPPTRFREKDHP